MCDIEELKRQGLSMQPISASSPDSIAKRFARIWLKEFGFEASRAFSRRKNFLASDRVNRTECLTPDIAMPGMTGFYLQERIATPRSEDSNRLYHRSGRGGRPGKRVLWASCSSPFSDTVLLRRSRPHFERQRRPFLYAIQERWRRS